MTHFVVKPTNHTQLAKLFKCSTKVLHKHLTPIKNELGNRTGHKYSIEQLLKIYEYLGYPLLQ